MKKLILALFVLSFITTTSVAYAQDVVETKKEQKEREKKEKEEKKRLEKEEKERKKKENAGKPKWSGLPDKMSGIAEVDAYILSIDSIYTNLNNYTDRINFYTAKTVPLLDENGQQVVNESGEAYVKTEITDKDGNKVSITNLIVQFPSVLSSLVGLTADATKIAAQGLIGATAFVSNPLAAFTYGKYLKDGPGVLAYIGKEGGRLYTSTKSQYDLLLKLRESEATTDFGLDINKDETIVTTEKDYIEAAGVDDIIKNLASL